MVLNNKTITTSSISTSKPTSANSINGRVLSSSSTTQRPSSTTSKTLNNATLTTTKTKPTTTTKKSNKKSKKIKKIKKIIESPDIVHMLLTAVKSNDLDSIEHIFNDNDTRNKIDLYHMASNSIVTAASLGYTNILKYLIDIGTDIANKNNNSIETGNIIKHDVLSNIQSGKPIQRAALYGHIECVELLHKQYNADITLVSEFHNLSALHLACQAGHTHVVEYIIKSLPNKQRILFIDLINNSDHNGVYNGWSSLHYASDNGHLDVVRSLVQYGCSIDLLTSTGDTACSIAAEHGKWSVLEYLILQGSNINAIRRELRLVHWAIYRASHRAVQFLVSHGAECESIEQLNSITTQWWHRTENLYTIIRSEFSEAIYREIDMAIYRGQRIYADKQRRIDIIKNIHWKENINQKSIYDIDTTKHKPIIHRLSKKATDIILQYDME